MDSRLNGILFCEDPDRFDQIRHISEEFSKAYAGNNIIQDDIFSIIGNYALRKEVPLEWIHFPVRDPEFCACTFVRKGRIFLMVNSALPLSKQIFAGAHELYHIWCYFEQDNSELEKKGSILESETIETGTTRKEEMEANAFAGSLLVSGDDLKEQIQIYRIDRNEIGADDILTMMDIFAVPYKAMVLRLLEERIISEDKACMFLAIPSEEINERMRITGKAKRWSLTPAGNERFGSLIENLTMNENDELLPKSRLESDWKRLKEIKSEYGIE